MSFAPADRPPALRSLCESCAWMREIISGKGSRFLLCERSRTEPRFAKYPAQPVFCCDGYDAARQGA